MIKKKKEGLINKFKEMSVDDCCKHWWQLWEKLDYYGSELSVMEDGGDPRSDMFGEQDIKEHKCFLREIEKEMAILEEVRPEIIEVMFPPKKENKLVNVECDLSFEAILNNKFSWI